MASNPSNPSLEELTSFPGFPHPTNSLFPLAPITSATSTTSSLSESMSTSTLTSKEVTYTPTPTQTKSTDSNNPWNSMGDRAHKSVVACAIIGMVITICVFLWFLRQRRKRAHALINNNGAQPGSLPLYNLQNHPPVSRFTGGGGVPPGNFAARAPGGDAPPPRYEEVVPPHLRVATGPPRMVHHGGDAEDGMVADGKTPLSEMPFEDVMLEPASSSSSMNSANQAFRAMHHNGVGDTRGHTNS